LTERDAPLDLSAAAADAAAAVLTIRRMSTMHSAAGLPVTALRSPSSEWTDEDMVLNWTHQVTVHQLQLQRLRDFCSEGMCVDVVEQKVCVIHSFTHQCC